MDRKLNTRDFKFEAYYNSVLVYTEYEVKVRFGGLTYTYIPYVLSYGMNETKSGSVLSNDWQAIGTYYIERLNGKLKLDIPAGVNIDRVISLVLGWLDLGTC